jgi:hypothetical protein
MPEERKNPRALAPCLQQILCGLSQTALNALVGLIQTYLTQLRAQVLIYQAKLRYLDYATAPVALTRKVLSTALLEAQGIIGLLPLELAAQCSPALEFTKSVQSNFAAINANVIAILDDANRLISLRDEVEAIIQELQQTIDLYVALLQQVDICSEVRTFVAEGVPT